MTKYKLFFYAGYEWKSDQGEVDIIAGDIYSLNSSALAFKNHLYEILVNNLWLKSYLADPDVWIKSAIDKTWNEYYTYILVYIDDLLILEKYPQNYMTMLESKYTVKPSFIGDPKLYLVDDVGKLLYGDGSYTWTIISDSYIK